MAPGKGHEKAAGFPPRHSFASPFTGYLGYGDALGAEISKMSPELAELELRIRRIVCIC